jgi:6-bladed beta-propeller protein
MMRRGASALFLLFMAACRPDTNRTSGTAWRLDSTPAIDIAATSAGGEPLFASAVSATRLSDGRIVIADAYEDAIRIFDSSGKLLRSVGRKGGGPGEFQGLFWLGQCGRDTLYAWDRMQQRMTVFSDTGAVVRSYTTRPNATIMACTSGGAMAFFGEPISMPSSVSGMMHATFSGPLFVIAPRDTTARLIDTLSMGEARPLGHVTELAISRDRVFVGAADSAVIATYQLTGTAAGPLRTDVPPRPATSRHFDRAIDLQAAQLGDAASRDVARRMLHQAATMPEHLPAYSGLFADPDGNLWVEISIPGDSTTWLRGFGGDGRVLGDVRLPIELHVFEIGRDYVLGSYDAADGNLHVATYRLRPR